MCEFISFRVEPGQDGLELKFANDLRSHRCIPGDGYECEWTKDDDGESLTVRLPEQTSEHVGEMVKRWILSNWPTRGKLVYHAVSTLDWSSESLYLSGCTGLTELPDGLSVGGWLDLSGTPAAKLPLPKDAKVSGNVYGLWRRNEHRR